MTDNSSSIPDPYQVDPHALFESISPNEVSTNSFHNEPVWRSAALIAPAPAPDLFGSHLDRPLDCIPRPNLKRESTDPYALNPHDLFARISPEDVAMSTFHSEPIWRKATLIAPAPAPDLFGSHLDQPFDCTQVSRPSLKRDQCPPGLGMEYGAISKPTLSKGMISLFADPVIIVSDQSEVPDLPFLLMPTHFETDLTLDTISSRVDSMLEETTGASFEFSQANYEWNIIHLNGSSHCKAQFHIYAGVSKKFVVEGNKLSGDSALFRSIYSQMKAAVQCDFGENINEYDSFAVYTPLPAAPALLAESCDSFGLGPIFRMAEEPFLESKVEASRTLCDLSVDESLRSQLCDAGCVPVLRDLISCNSVWAQQHAIASLANLSENPQCQEAIIEAGVLPALLSLAVNGTYQSAELRRLAVYVLANVTSSLATRVVTVLGKSELSSWSSTVESLADQRLRIHAIRAKDNLKSVLAQ